MEAVTEDDDRRALRAKELRARVEAHEIRLYFLRRHRLEVARHAQAVRLQVQELIASLPPRR